MEQKGANNQDHDAAKNLDEIVAQSGFENIQIAPMSPNPNHESKDQEQKENNHAKAHMQEKLTRKISEPSIESATYSSHGDNCATNTCLDTKNAESEGKHFCKIFELYHQKRETTNSPIHEFRMLENVF